MHTWFSEKNNAILDPVLSVFKLLSSLKNIFIYYFENFTHLEMQNWMERNSFVEGYIYSCDNEGDDIVLQFIDFIYCIDFSFFFC